ncbi:MAG: 2-oxoglutarate dehydrogenase E2 component (dihydrolipoamide succinyltransferase) [Polaribacter sp.]|jgi:2-oxoglutarate dehydrogenase E2 component (dihydrolipoamide succinyltransferase)
MNYETEIKLTEEEIEGTEATFSTWLVAIGDAVKEGDPIAELETDKVAMEVCAPKSGTIKFQKIKQGDKVEAGQVLGIISEGGVVDYKDRPSLVISADQLDAKQTTNRTIETIRPSGSLDENTVDKNSISPAVRRLLSENNLNIDNVKGSGKKGRVTRDDVTKFVKVEAENLVVEQVKPTEKEIIKEAFTQTSSYKVSKNPNLKSQLIPHSNMRKSIANHMVNSLLETSPHVTSIFEMDMGNIIEHRKWHKKEYLDLGIKLTFTAYFLLAMAKAVKKVPQVNAKFHEDALEIFSDINIGVGTALGGSDLKDSGLVVPVIQQVQNMSLFQVAKALHTQTEKARTNQLKTSDMKNGTLTISNHGVSGSLLATPIIINQPQVAILGVGKLEKRVVVEEINGKDEMVIRPKCYVSLSIDHRALDAHQTNLYLSEFVNIIEHWGE